MKGKEKIDTSKLNEVIRLSSSILKIAFIFFFIIGLYAITLVLKEWQVFKFLFTFLKILSPLFIGIIIAWLLEPSVKYLHQKGINRILGTILVYTIMLGVLYLTVTTLFPSILNQVNDFLSILPSILDSLTNWANSFLEHFRDINIIDIDTVKLNVVNNINNLINSLTTDIPTMTINFISHLLSTVGIFALGLIIGFYLLVGFDDLSRVLLSLLPPRVRDDIKSLLLETNSSLFSYIRGMLIIALVIFVSTTIALTIIGVKAPVLLGLICGLTNIIPYIGPYIGGAITGIVAFTQSVTLGILSIVLITIIQTLESTILQPLVMSRTMKLHPIVVLISILIFGYFWGVLGMVIAIPLVAILRMILTFFDKKYDIFRIFKNNLN